jgi:hypothetical protein
MTNLVEKIKQDLGSTISDFYAVMKDDLEIDRTEYRMHFTRMADLLFEIDRCNTFNELEALYETGNLDICGGTFQEFVYELIKRMNVQEAV